MNHKKPDITLKEKKKICVREISVPNKLQQKYQANAQNVYAWQNK